MSKIDIEKLKNEIIKRLKPLDPDKIILFGSYAYGEPNEESDIDLFLIKDDLKLEEMRKYQKKARRNLRDLIYKYHVGFDVLSAPSWYINHKKDYFYKMDILEKGKVIFE
ncbi:nucleotidyltransferase domain-containing protein [Nitratiruptor tergarcus]|uniref:Nucleotidyltransferase domain-containing protein n=1 Tax=Nitratiruptor tergarcus DSM 16512 TaxID=1069081 RepID=A0A1W1WT56_9BACT|nr:nucleotidyltransferase domain-containing protein [Nitratiruptor tergarcus]SMC09484.1 Nucleotidyltransferase domain-containing protein [Nitratiruptor tergarcus DSM 16512]